MTILVGVLHSLSGTMSISESPLVDAARLAVDEINSSGGVLGQPLEILIEDCCSDPQNYASKARQLIARSGIDTIFGCWTSSSRKAVIPVLEETGAQLWYPVQYEGLEQSPHVFYTGSCLNQQIIPALDWCFGRGWKDVYLVGSDYVFPRTAHQLIRNYVNIQGGKVEGEKFIPLGGTNFPSVVEEIGRSHPSVVINTLNGGSNIAFYHQLERAGIMPQDTPVMAFSVAEVMVQRIGKSASGHYACWSYFQSLPTPENMDFVSKFKARYGGHRVTSDPIATAYSQIYLWKTAVEKAGSSSASAVRDSATGVSCRGPAGDIQIQNNHHVSKQPRIGRIRTDGQFEIVWDSGAPIEALPWLGVEKTGLPTLDIIKEALSNLPKALQYAGELEAMVESVKQAGSEVRRLNTELEARVLERTSNLSQMNARYLREIASRKQIEKSLKESEKKFRALFESANDGIFILDMEGYILDVNKTICSLLGYSRDEILGIHISQLVHPSFSPMIADRMEKLRRDGHVLFESAHVRKDKSKVFVELNTKIIEIEGKQVMFGAVRDITWRREAELALRKSEERYRRTFENMHDVVYQVDLAGNIIDISPSILKSSGYTREELIGKPIINYYYYPEDRARLLKALESAGEVNDFAVRVKSKDNRLVYASADVHFVYDESGRRCGIEGSLRDVTQQKMAAEALAASEKKYRTLYKTMRDAFVAVDMQRNIIEFNSTYKQLMGYSDEELLKLTCRSITPEKWHLTESRIIEEQVLSRGYSDVYEKEYRKKDGIVFPVEMRTFLIRDEAGNPVSMWSIVRDITERRRAEEELKKYRGHLEELVAERTSELSVMFRQLQQSQKLEAIGILAGGIAHEFSNILTTMKGSMYLVRKALQEGSPILKYAEQVVASINKAGNLSQSLLTFSRKQTISLHPTNFNEIIHRVSTLLSRLIGEHIELIVILTEKNPTVMADINQIEQVMINLATNARDAMPDGGKLIIQTDVEEINGEFVKEHGFGLPGEYAVLIVSDTGMGMEKEVREKIFEPFFTTKVVGKGSGLGLAVTYGIVKQHNGFIDVKSVPGEGSTFRIYLSTVQTEVIPPGNEGVLSVKRGEETILLGEDDADTRATMKEMLEMTGYAVLEADDGEEVLRVFRENKEKVKLALLDIGMPKKNGRAVYEEIKKIRPGAKVLFVSGYTEDIIDSYGVREEGLNFISKAALPDEILSKVREVLDK